VKNSSPIKYPAVIFDLDGTLADTIKDLADATNWGLARLNLPPHPVERYKLMVGAGRTELCRRAAGPDHQDKVGQLAQLMTQYYGEHCFDFTRPYPGIMELLRKLSARSIRLAVLSNKPQPFVQLTMEKLFGEFSFAAVVGDLEGMPRKPDPAGAILIAQKLRLDPAQIAYVGDTAIDMETANRAGMYAVGVSWGFRERKELVQAGAKVIVDTPQDLYQTLWEPPGN
jgi:phosphoglycolate phosphatase